MINCWSESTSVRSHKTHSFNNKLDNNPCNKTIGGIILVDARSHAGLQSPIARRCLLMHVWCNDCGEITVWAIHHDRAKVRDLHVAKNWVGRVWVIFQGVHHILVHQVSSFWEEEPVKCERETAAGTATGVAAPAASQSCQVRDSKNCSDRNDVRAGKKGKMKKMMMTGPAVRMDGER